MLISSSGSGVHDGRTFPRYRIQLDAPPSTRWDRVVDDYLQYLPLMKEEAQKFPESVHKSAREIAVNIREFFPLDYALELEGIAARFGLPLETAVAFNILYDVMAYERKHVLYLGCTSIVARDNQGRIWHGRNLDYGMRGLLRKAIFIADFYRGDRLQYTALKFVLNAGVVTGQKQGGFTVSVNARYSGTSAMNMELASISKFRNLIGFVTLEEESTYSAAVERLSTLPLISPSYIIVGGAGPFEGAVITRDRATAVDVRRLTEDNWYLVQSNVDNWTDDVDMRSITASRFLSEMSRTEINPRSILEVLAAPPIRNNLTIYSTIMSAANPSMIYDATIINNTALENTEEQTDAMI